MREDLGFAGNIGAALGRGIGGSLEALAEASAKKKKEGLLQEQSEEQSRINRGILMSSGFGEDEAALLAGLPQQDIGRLVLEKRKEESSRLRNERMAALYAQGGGEQGIPQGAMQEALGAISPQEQAQFLQYQQRQQEMQQRAELDERKLSQQRGLAEEGLRVREEAPERKAMVDRVISAEKAAKVATESDANLKSIIDLSHNEDLRTGPFRQALKLVGMEGLFQSPTSEYASKLVGDLNLKTLMGTGAQGRATAALWDRISTTNPSLLSSPEGIRAVARFRLIEGDIAKEYGKAIRQVRSRNRGKALPLGAWNQVEEIAGPKVEALQKKALQIGDSFLTKAQDKVNTFSFGDLAVGSQALHPSTGEPLADGRVLRDPKTRSVIFVSKNGKWIKP